MEHGAVQRQLALEHFCLTDPVAIDSVCYDFLYTEWPAVVDANGMAGGAEDYLHEAAQPTIPLREHSTTRPRPAAAGKLGSHEHWNNASDKNTAATWIR